MTPLALLPTLELVSGVAGELLDAHISGDDALWIVSTALIVEALKRARGNKTRAAKMLGMERHLLNHQIGERHLEPVVERVLEAVKIAEHIQPTLFPGRKTSTPAHSFVLKFSRAADAS